jgi:predicted short-subunit dehydrogenase-like oxidoreductase (DUF2520 family)
MRNIYPASKSRPGPAAAKSETPRISILGAGRLGTSLGRSLSRKDFRVKVLSSSRLNAAKKDSFRFSKNEVVFICLPDREISSAAEKLSRTGVDFKGKTFFHCSGLLPSHLLKPLKEKGASTGSFHPIQSFAAKNTPLRHFKGVYIGVEGDAGALAVARLIIRKLGGKFLRLEEIDKPLYHTACSIASNFFVLLLDISSQLMADARIHKALARRIILPLVQGTLHNVKKFGLEQALTGPLSRGDIDTIKRHLSALKNSPQPYRRIYEDFVSMASGRPAGSAGDQDNEDSAGR